MRATLLILLTACWSRGSAPPGNVGETPRPAPRPAVEPVDAPEDCMSRVEMWAPGNHDRYTFEDAATSLYGFKDGKGNIVVQPRFRYAYEFGPGGVAAAVDANAKFVFFGPSGATLADAYPFDNGPDYFQEGYARIVDGNKKVGFVSDRGDIVIAPQFDEAEGFCHGVAEVKLGGATLRVDAHGLPTAP